MAQPPFRQRQQQTSQSIANDPALRIPQLQAQVAQINMLLAVSDEDFEKYSLDQARANRAAQKIRRDQMMAEIEKLQTPAPVSETPVEVEVQNPEVEISPEQNPPAGNVDQSGGQTEVSAEVTPSAPDAQQ